MPNWTAADIPSQAGKLAVVTGPGGLGYEIALALARAGSAVVLAGRNPKTGQASVDRIKAAAPNADIRFGKLDLADLHSVETFAAGLLQTGRPVDLLVNNAGVMMLPGRELTVDGFERQFGTNYLGHFALTAQLLPLLNRAKGRVVSVSSISAMPGRIHFDDLSFARAYNPSHAYEQSKLAMILFAYELQRQSVKHSWELTSFAAHPGVAHTDLIDKGPGATSLFGVMTRLFPFLRQPASRGALPILFAATSPDAVPGAYYGPDGFQEIRGYPKRVPGPSQANDTAVAERLWQTSEHLTGVQFGAKTRAAV